MVDDTIDFCPIDHTAAFGYLSDYRQVRNEMLFLSPEKSILNHRFVQTIARFATPQNIQNISKDILAGMDVALERMDLIFEQVPSDWGLSKKSRLHLRGFLADRARNERIASAYLAYLK